MLGEESFLGVANLRQSSKKSPSRRSYRAPGEIVDLLAAELSACEESGSLQDKFRPTVVDAVLEMHSCLSELSPAVSRSFALTYSQESRFSVWSLALEPPAEIPFELI